MLVQWRGMLRPGESAVNLDTRSLDLGNDSSVMDG